MTDPAHRAVVLAAHGTRSPEGRDRVRALREAVAARLVDRGGARDVRLGYVDVQEPHLEDVTGTVREPVVIVPLFLAAGSHVRHDVARAAARCPAAQVMPHVGAWPIVEDLLLEAANALDAASLAEGPLLLASTGSSDRDAREEVIALGRRVEARLGREAVVGFLGGPGPSALDLAPRCVGIVGHLLLPGHFADRAAALGRAHGIPTSVPLLATDHGLAAIADAIAARVG